MKSHNRKSTTVLKHISPRYIHPVRTAHRTQSVTTSKTNRWTLYAETVTGHCDNRTERVRTPCRQIVTLSGTDSSHWLWNGRLKVSAVGSF